MKQNILKETKDGIVKFQFEKCLKCGHHKFCYMDWNGDYHKGVPTGLSEDCLGEEE